MKRLKAFILSAAMALSMVAPAMAVNRVQWPMNVQPPSSWLNTMGRDTEYGFGQLIWDFLGRSNNGMIFTNLTVSPQSGLYVQVAPSTTNTIGSVYSVYSADLSPFGTGTQQLAADPTQLFHHGMLFSATPAIGPLNAPGTSGQSTAYTIECQVQTQDITPQTVNFVSSTNVASSAVADRDRADIVVCQSTTGVTGTSPTAPAADTGWLAVGNVVIPYGTSTITTGMITQAVPFNGFLPNGSAATFMDLATNQTAAGNKTFTGQTSFNNFLQFTNGTVTLPAALPAIAGDYQASPGMMFNIASGSAGYRFYVNNVLKGTIDTGGYYWAGSSNFGPTSMNVNGTATIGGGTFDGMTLASKASQPLYLNSKNTWLEVNYNDAGVVSGLAVYDGGTTNYAQLQAAKLNFSGASTSSYTSTDATVYGNLIMPNQAVGQCAQFDGSHHLVAAGGACGLASGSITSVTGTAPITATTSSGAVTVGISATPTFTNATLGSAANAGVLYLGTDGLFGINRSGSALTFTGSAGSTATVEADGGFISGSSNFFPTYLSENGPVTATQFNGSGAGLTAGTVPNNALVTSPLTALTCSLNVACGTGTTPTVQLVSAPSFSGAVTASQFNGSGAGLTSGTVPNAALVTPALTGLACSGNIVCGAGTTPTVQATNAPTFTGAVTAGSLVDNGGATFGGGLSLFSTGNTFQGNDFYFGSAGTTAGTVHLRTNGYSNTDTATINSAGTYTVGSSYFGATGENLNGTLAFPAAGTATSTQDYANVGGITFNGSRWTAGAATARSETLNFNVGDASYAGIQVTGQSDTNNTSFGITGLRPTFNFNSTQQSTAQWSIIEGDSSGLTPGDLTFFDRTNSAQMLTLEPTDVKVGGNYTQTGRDLTVGSGGGNGTVNAGGSGALDLNWLSGTGGVAFCNGANGCNASVTAAGQFSGVVSNAYGGLEVNGVKNGWSGIHFKGSSGNIGTLMMQDTATNPVYGFYNNVDNGWMFTVNYTTAVTAAGGYVSAAAFYNGSKREWKHDIRSIDNVDACGMLPNFYRYKYNKGHGDPTDEKIGYMADGPDGAVEWLAGPHKDHFDGGALATLDGVCAKQLNKRLSVLESRQALGAGVVVNGTTHDPRVDALQVQVKWLWIALIALSLLVLLILAALILAVKYLVAVL